MVLSTFPAATIVPKAKGKLSPFPAKVEKKYLFQQTMLHKSF